MKVVIDGVEYVPAASVEGVEPVLRALALQYHTPETLAEYGTAGLSISINEDGEGETFDEFAARLAREEGRTA